VLVLARPQRDQQLGAGRGVDPRRAQALREPHREAVAHGGLDRQALDPPLLERGRERAGEVLVLLPRDDLATRPDLRR
jgi:hypothetical protein